MCGSKWTEKITDLIWLGSGRIACSCTECPTGRFCSAGKYQIRPRLESTCHACPAGRYIEEDGQDDTKHDSINDCKTCPKGYEFKDQTSECQICTFSQYQDQTDIDGVKCKKCAANEFITDDREIAAAHLSEGGCLECTPGKFSKSGDRFCEACAVGKERVDSLCVACIAGQYSKFAVGLFTCQNCLAGFYQAEPGQPFCLPCIPVRVFFCFDM